MKKTLAAALMSVAALFSTSAVQAQVAPQAVSVWQPSYYTYSYLGGAWSPLHCAQLAGAYGFGYYYFGWGYAGGLYVTNACFGVQPLAVAYPAAAQ